MVHLGPLNHMEIDGQDVTDCIQTPAPWAMDHELLFLAQSESRPGGDGWKECRTTGKARAVCSCGYDSGLVDRGQLPTNDDLREHHHPRT